MIDGEILQKMFPKLARIMWLSMAFKNNVIRLEAMEWLWIYTSAVNTRFEQPSKLPFVRI